MPKTFHLARADQHTWTRREVQEIYRGWAIRLGLLKWAKCPTWVGNCVDRYGLSESSICTGKTDKPQRVLGGTRKSFSNSHFASPGRRALPTARVGGPVPRHGGQFTRLLRALLRVTPRHGMRWDAARFVVHARAADFADGHVRMGIAIAQPREGFRLIASSELESKPIVIGESDPDGCAACQGSQLGYRNTTMYSSYTAAAFARTHDLASRHGVNLEGALTWAFEFENQPYFAGFRVLGTNGIDQPVMNVFRMFSRMGAERLAVTSDGAVSLDAIVNGGVRDRPDVAALASRGDRRVTVLAWHYHDDDVAGPAADVTLSIDGLAMKQGRARLRHFRIDADHSNAYTAWQRMGSPHAPTPAQYSHLEKAGQLEAMPGPSIIDVAGSRATMGFILPRQAVSLLIVEW